MSEAFQAIKRRRRLIMEVEEEAEEFTSTSLEALGDGPAPATETVARPPPKRRGRPPKLKKQISPIPTLTPTSAGSAATIEHSLATRIDHPNSSGIGSLSQQSPEEQFLADMMDSTGIRASSLNSYRAPMRRWKEFCERHRDQYAGLDGRALYHVDSEEKLIKFFKEDVFTRTTIKHTKAGADSRSQVGIKQQGESSDLVEAEFDLLQELNDAPLDSKGRKMIGVPLGTEAIMMTRKAMIRIHLLQKERKEVGLPGPSGMKTFNSIMAQHKEGLFAQGVQSGQRRSADCVLRDSYTMSSFHKILMGLWTRERQLPREFDLNYRDMFSISVRHNMLLRDEDLRHINFSDCLSTIITQRHQGEQQAIALTFKLNMGKTNKRNQDWYACALRHHDVRRCCFSSFAFYMFQLWQGSEHKEVKGLAIKDVRGVLARPDWCQLKILPSPNDPTISIVPQTTWHAVDKVFMDNNIHSSKKTHGGRHAGTIESYRLGIRQEDIKDGGRWMAERGGMESFHMPSLPSNFALEMAGFRDKSFFLSRNSIKPPIPLQQMVFPWIEDAYGNDNESWREECLKEMNEEGPDIVPDTEAESNQPAESEICSATTYSEADVAKRGFLRLLVRCRRIVIQDAAFRLHHKHNSRILQDDVFHSPMFKDFQREMSALVDRNEPDPLQNFKDTVPAIAEELKGLTVLVDGHFRQIQSTLQNLQQSQLQSQQHTSAPLQSELQAMRQQQLQWQHQQHQLQVRWQRQVFVQQQHQNRQQILMLQMLQNQQQQQQQQMSQLLHEQLSGMLPSQELLSQSLSQSPELSPISPPFQWPQLPDDFLTTSAALPPMPLPQSTSVARSTSKLKKSKSTTFIAYKPKK